MGVGSSAGLAQSATSNSAQTHSEHLYAKDGKFEVSDRLPMSMKTVRDSCQGISGSGSMGIEKYNEGHGMKRKLQDRQDSQDNLETFCSEKNLPAGDYMKEMKPLVSVTEGQESSACRGDDKLNKKGKVTRIILSGSRDSLTARNGRQQQKISTSCKPKLTLDDLAKLKKDLGCEQLSAAATSSSSKVSGSRKRSSYQKVVSPVESVCSSPLRSSNLAKVSLARKGNLGNDCANTCAGGARQFLEQGSKLDRNQIGVGSRGEVSGVFQAESLSFPKLECQDHDVSGEADSSVKPVYNYNSKNLLTNNEDTLTQHQHCLTDVHSLNDHQIGERRNTIHVVRNDTFLRIPGVDSSLLSEDINKSSYNAEKINMKPSGILSDQGVKPNNDVDTVLRHSGYSQGDTKVKMSAQNCSSEKSVDLCRLDKRSIHDDKSWDDFTKPSNLTRLELRHEKKEAHPQPAGKPETPTHVRQPASLYLKGSGLDTSSSIECRGVSKVLQQHKNSVHQNGAHQVECNHAVDQSSYGDIGKSKTMKGYNGGQAANDVLREAEDLKGHADHLKVCFCIAYF